MVKQLYSNKNFKKIKNLTSIWDLKEGSLYEGKPGRQGGNVLTLLNLGIGWREKNKLT